ncbi:rRNA adenine N-6-methyltransferase family protein [Candidatus Protofrankia californiensis]|uniref:rRNA adenine N-6-methyltransferase family protein n=1 Tax=Candidatus Protofrankia californiensis TaxID=1839754 RepID=UPI001F4964F0|nr:rRNA adenine N-6-methyltransferase family protein [Candidatus Protofrankia californiensis]
MLDMQRDGKRMKREDFIPDVIWIRREDGWMIPLDRADNPDAWLKLVNSDDSIVTQADDGTDEYNGKGIIPTSSSSAPRVMSRMLDLLDVREGMDVLEIGAGTGYNAAVLAERAAPGRVTTVEVDPVIAEHARQALRRTGHPVTVVTGDGVLGYPDGAPYDRMMATASALQIPYAWVEQTRPGGRIVLPLVSGFFECQAFLCLTVDGDGTAQGRFHDVAGFMRLRNQRDDAALWGDNEDDARITTTRLYPRAPFTEFEAGFALGLMLPGWVAGQREACDGTEILRVSHFASGSWASFSSGTDEHEVRQYGPRRLWDELEAAYDRWLRAGRPDHTRFGATITPEGQSFWLDVPEQVVSADRRAVSS